MKKTTPAQRKLLIEAINYYFTSKNNIETTVKSLLSNQNSTALSLSGQGLNITELKKSIEALNNTGLPEVAAFAHRIAARCIISLCINDNGCITTLERQYSIGKLRTAYPNIRLLR